MVDYPSYGTLSGTPPNLTYTPEAGFNGGDSFTFMVNDEQLDSTIATVSIAIINSDSTYFDDFETYAAGTDPVDWLDTGPQNSMVEDDTLFRVFDLNGENVFGTTLTQTNIHSHYMGTGVDAFSSYKYTGSMMITSANGGIGVTFLSQYPSEDAYYRLRRHGSNSFHISPHGTTIRGKTDTGVVPVPNVWYRFVIIVEDTETRTEIRAKVWPDGTTEPADWQVNAYDNSPTRLTSGTIGVWSYSSGSKYWDDLAVNELTPDTY